MAQGIARAIDRALEGRVSPWKLCRPAGNLKVFSLMQAQHDPSQAGSQSAMVSSTSIHDWTPSNAFKLELAIVPVITGNDGPKARLSVGTSGLLRDLFEDMEIPSSALSCFLDNRTQFTSYLGPSETKRSYFLNFRQWAIAWTCDVSKGTSKAVLLWMAGSWTKSGIADYVETFLLDLSKTCINHDTPGLLAVLLCARNVAESLADLDEEAFRTERRLRQVIQDGKLKQEDELGRLSAAHSWLAARSVRERARLSAAAAFIEYATTHRRDKHLNKSPVTSKSELEALQLMVRSLTDQAAKLSEDSALHLSTIFNLIAQRDQATNLAIAAASREIALQSKIDQANSLDIAEASKKIAEEAKKDSTAMKMIALVTMIYLPGTFVATCFSMQLFEWDAPASRVINPRIWTYFLFTGVLTILTIGGFVGWLWWQERRSKQSNVKEQPVSIGAVENEDNEKQSPAGSDSSPKPTKASTWLPTKSAEPKSTGDMDNAVAGADDAHTLAPRRPPDTNSVAGILRIPKPPRSASPLQHHSTNTNENGAAASTASMRLHVSKEPQADPALVHGTEWIGHRRRNGLRTLPISKAPLVVIQPDHFHRTSRARSRSRSRSQFRSRSSSRNPSLDQAFLSRHERSKRRSYDSLEPRRRAPTRRSRSRSVTRYTHTYLDHFRGTPRDRNRGRDSDQSKRDPQAPAKQAIEALKTSSGRHTTTAAISEPLYYNSDSVPETPVWSRVDPMAAFRGEIDEVLSSPQAVNPNGECGVHLTMPVARQTGTAATATGSEQVPYYLDSVPGTPVWSREGELEFAGERGWETELGEAQLPPRTGTPGPEIELTTPVAKQAETAAMTNQAATISQDVEHDKQSE